MHCLTSQGNWELQIDYQLKNGTRSYLHYNKFAIGSAEDQYPLTISGFDSIGLTDPFYTFGQTPNTMKFTSCDRDNDLNGGNCAHSFGGFWYHHICDGLEINDKYHDASILNLNGDWYSSTLVEIKLRPQFKNCLY